MEGMMSNRTLGLSLMIVGLALVATAIVLGVNGSSDDQPQATETTSTVAPTSTMNVSTSFSTQTTTTTSPPATTTTSQTTTSTTRPPETIEEFVGLFADALSTGDRAFVLDRLYPDVVDAYPADVCETWVDDEIMALSDYRLTGDLSGPVDKSVTVAGRQMTIRDVYSAPVSFSFGGQSFDSSADFVLVDGIVHWLGMCE
jgi:hypothetical protein